MVAPFQFSVQRLRNRLFLIGILVVSPIGALAETTLQLGDSTGTAGNTISIPLNLVTGDPVSAAQIELFADPAIAEIVAVSGSAAGDGHIVDSEDLGNGRVRVVVYSDSNDFLFTEVLVDLQVVLKSTIGESDRSLIVESIQLADAGADLVNTTLIPNATLSAPDSSVTYMMGDEVSASGTAFGTRASVERVEFLVNGWPVASDTESPYEGDFPLYFYGNVTLSALAVDTDGNRFETPSEDFIVLFPPTLDAWLDVFFSPEEQLDPDIGTLLADTDFDGQTTIMEYALGSHPRRNGGSHESRFFLDMQDGSYQFSYIRPIGVSDIEYTIQISNDLAIWSNASLIRSVEVTPIDNYMEEIRLLPLNPASPREFGRLLIEQVEP